MSVNMYKFKVISEDNYKPNVPDEVWNEAAKHISDELDREFIKFINEKTQNNFDK